MGPCNISGKQRLMFQGNFVKASMQEDAAGDLELEWELHPAEKELNINGGEVEYVDIVILRSRKIDVPASINTSILSFSDSVVAFQNRGRLAGLLASFR
ncbi:hypothetical protein AKJ16_DCAP26456, partial [Drosera capensis]